MADIDPSTIKWDAPPASKPTAAATTATPAAPSAPDTSGIKWDTPAAPSDIHWDAPDWRPAAFAEIAATPGLNKAGQMAVLEKHQTAAQGPLLNPQYGAQVNQNLSVGQRALEYTVAGLHGFSEAGLAPFKAVAPHTVNQVVSGGQSALGYLTGRNTADDALYDYQPDSVGNTVARGIGAAVPMVLTAGTANPMAAATALGALSGAGGARDEIDRMRSRGVTVTPGQELVGAVGQGTLGAGEGLLQGKLMGLAGARAAGIANPFLRAGAAAGIDAAGNAAFGAAGHVAGNIVAQAYDPGRPILPGTGDAAIAGAAGGLLFTPSSIGHANAARDAATAGRIGEVVGANDVRLAPQPQGRAGLAAKYIAQAVGRKVVWFESDAPVQAFPDGDTIYANARSPRDALPAILAHEALGHVSKEPAVAAQLEQLPRQYPEAQATAEQEYLHDLEAGGFADKAQRLRADPAALREEGTAKFIEEALRGDGALADEIAGRYPGLFARLSRSVSETVDNLTGGNRQKGRIVREQLGLVGDVFARAGAAAEKLGGRAAQREEGMLDRLDPQLTEAARDDQAARAQRDAELADDGRQRLAARELIDDERQTREEDAEVERRLEEQRRRAGQEAIASDEAARVRGMTDREIYEEVQRRGMRVEQPLRAQGEESTTPPPTVPGTTPEPPATTPPAEATPPAAAGADETQSPLAAIGGVRRKFKAGDRTFTVDYIPDANEPRKAFITGLASEGKGGTFSEVAPALAEHLKADGFDDVAYRADAEDGRDAARQRLFERVRQMVKGGEEGKTAPGAAIPVVETRGQTPANGPAQAVQQAEKVRPSRTPVKRNPRKFTKTDIERRILQHFHEYGGDEGAARTEELQEASGGDLLGDSQYTFFKKLPDEVKSFMQGRPETRRLFRVTDDVREARGADTLAALGDDAYFQRAQHEAQGKESRTAQAVEFARQSQDPEMQLMAAIHDNLPAARDRGPTEIVKPADKPTGTRFTLFGSKFEIVSDGEGHRLLKDGDEYPTVPADYIPEMPADKGSVKAGRAKSKDVKDVLAPAAQDEIHPLGERVKNPPQGFYDPEATGDRKPSQQGIFGQTVVDAQGGTQGSMFHQPTEARPAESAQDAKIRAKFSEGEKATAKLFTPGAEDAGNKIGNKIGEKISTAPTAGPEKVKGGRTSIEVSAGANKLTVEQERPGGKSWRVVRKGMTVGEVSRPTTKVLGGGFGRDEAIAEASRILGGAKPPSAAKPEEPTIHDLPDDEIPFSVAPAKPGEEEKPAPPALRVAAGAAKSAAEGVRRWLTIKPVPRLTAAGVGDAAVEHASAKIAAPKIVDDLVAKVLPDSYKDEKATAALADVLLKNRYLGAYDRFSKAADDLEAQAKNETPAKAERLTEQAAEARNRARAIAELHKLPEYDADVVAAMKNPEMKAAIERYQEHVGQWLDDLFKEVKGAGEEPGFEAPRQGRHFDAYLPIIGEIEGPEAAAAQKADDFLPPNNTMNAKVKRDRFDRRASYTGTFDTDLHALLSAVVGPRWNEATKLRFYKSLLASGAAVESGQDVERPKALQGKPVAALDVTMPRYNPETGKTSQVGKKLYLRADLHREVRDALDTDQRSPQNPIAKALTAVQLFQLADAVTHAKNIASRVYMSQGAGSSLFDVVKANPVVGIPRTAAKLFQAWREIAADGPGVRAEIADMARQGMIRATFDKVGLLDKIAERTGWEWVKNLSTGDMLHSLDTAARVLLNRQYSELVRQGRAEDTPTSRRNFVNTVGQYNHRLMGPLMKTMRDAGISPFVVAGRTYNRNAVDVVTGNPQFAAPTKAAQRNARLTQLGMLASIGLTAPLVNMITTGTPGGRSGTPIGAIDLGGDDTDGDGNHAVWDVLQLAGIRRGLRATGLDALGQGLAEGKDANTIGGNAFIGGAQAALHPWLGPAVGFGFKALTGRQLDIRGKMEAATIPEGGAKQYLENLRAAVESQNPLVYALTRPAFQAAGLDQKPADEETGYLGGLLETAAKSPLGAAGVKEVRPGKDSAEELADRLAKLRFGSASMTPEDAAKFAIRRQLTAKLKADPAAGEEAIEQAVEEGKISEQQAANIHRKAGTSPFLWNVRSLSGADAAKVYAAGTDEEKEQIRDAVTQKLIGSKDLSAEQQDAKLEELGIEPPPDLAMRRELHQLGAKARAYAQAKKKYDAGDRSAREEMLRNRLAAAERSRLQRLQTIGRAITKAKKEGGAQAAGKIRRLVASV